MTRLGLWGPGCAFREASDVTAVLKNSAGSMEMLAVSLKSEGAYIARSLGFRGVKLGSVSLALQPDERAAYARRSGSLGALRQPRAPRRPHAAAAALPPARPSPPRPPSLPTPPRSRPPRSYNGLASLWRDLLCAVDDHNAAAPTAASKFPRAGLTRALSRSFEQLLLALKAREIKAQARRALRAGKSVVICLFSTGDSSTVRAIGGDGGASALVSTAREVVANCLLQVRCAGCGGRGGAPARLPFARAPRARAALAACRFAASLADAARRRPPPSAAALRRPPP